MSIAYYEIITNVMC